MSDQRPRHPIALDRCGAIAREVLAEAGDVRVIAAFERSVYVACPHGIVCLGMQGIGAGPINAGLDLAPSRAWTDLGVMLDGEGSCDGRLLGIGDLLLDVTSGESWHPPAMPPFVAADATRGLHRLRELAAPRLPDEGLAALVLAADAPPLRSAVHKAAAGSISALRQTLPAVLRQDSWVAPALRSSILLVGLGPGFTPSGDDLLGGLMLALSAAGRTGLRDALWNTLAPELDDLTTPPSAMHLSAAADGMGSASLHALLNDVLAGGTPALAARFDSVAGIGHTSGWDALAGLVLGLDALTAGGS